MNTIKAASLFSTSICDEQETFFADFTVVCMWSFLGLLVAAVVGVLGFEPDIGQALALAG